MEFREYEQYAKRTAAYPDLGNNLTYPTLGLAGEAGEVAEKVKKLYRDDNGHLSTERRDAIVKELGDVLWYICMIAHEIGVPLEEVPKANIAKLSSRATRSTINGDGDDR